MSDGFIIRHIALSEETGRIQMETSPMILQEVLPRYGFISGWRKRPADPLTSHGDLNYFTHRNMHRKGCTGRCLEGCKAKRKMHPLMQKKIYLEHERIGYRQGNRGWPLDVLVPSGPTEEKLIEALKTGPYGKCVFHCNNNVVDHQVVNLNMTDGTTMRLLPCVVLQRRLPDMRSLWGTRGEVIVDMQPDEKESKIWIEHFDPERTKRNSSMLQNRSEDFSGHGGGDNRMVEEFWIL